MYILSTTLGGVWSRSAINQLSDNINCHLLMYNSIHSLSLIVSTRSLVPHHVLLIPSNPSLCVNNVC